MPQMAKRKEEIGKHMEQPAAFRLNSVWINWFASLPAQDRADRAGNKPDRRRLSHPMRRCQPGQTATYAHYETTHPASTAITARAHRLWQCASTLEQNRARQPIAAVQQ